MARKSRRAESEYNSVQKIYKTAVYVRKSIKDTESIENQIRMVQMYVDKKSDLKMCEIYVDNGVSGITFDRPEFERMLIDIKNGKIDCVVVKDLSRFGRDYIVGSELIEMLLPKWGVRFIAINDDYDSLDPLKADILAIHIKNIMNQIYSYDLSAKISPVLHRKQECGEFIGAWAPYGYLKSEECKGKLIIDPETAPVVQEIFRLRLSEMSLGMILKELTHQGIPSPSQYRFKKGIVKTERLNCVKWFSTTISKILSNEVYLGHMIQGKRKSALLTDSEKITFLPKEEWIMVKNTHEPIIDQVTFDAVQQINEFNSKKYTGGNPVKSSKTEENILKDIVYCGNCGAKLLRRKEGIYIYYVCRAHRENLDYCSSEQISGKDLFESVFGAIRVQILTALNMDVLLKKDINKAITKSKKYELGQKINQEKERLTQILRYKETLYMNYIEGLVNEHDFLYMQKRYTEKQTNTNSLIDELTKQERKIDENRTGKNSWLQAFLNYSEETQLNKEMVETLIEKIVVFSKNVVEVHFRFMDAFAEMHLELSDKTEVPNE